ncbi:transcriptional regulator [Clostridium botulinum]|uniref:transcriptional regulator n=1 Tax=Clostridium botulinum TaxID=1491 RepID=UPI000773A3ED|nr:transcriptional regulator [Clostridium botulinum]
MIGLEYICELYSKSYNSVAEELGISRQSVNGWLKRTRPIPKKYLPKLSNMFELPEEYFYKELTEEEKKNVEKEKIFFDIGKIVDLIMEYDEVKEMLEEKTVEEHIDYVEAIYYGVIDTIEYVVNKKTPDMECKEIVNELNSVKREQEKDIKEILEIVKDLIFNVDTDLKKFKQYIENYK